LASVSCLPSLLYLLFFFSFTHTSTTHISTLSLHDALPISTTAPATARAPVPSAPAWAATRCARRTTTRPRTAGAPAAFPPPSRRDRKSTRLNSSHEWISYAVFCLKKKKNKTVAQTTPVDKS